MSLKIINYTSDLAGGMGEKGIEFIKQETGVELTALDNGSASIQKFSMRFPDMETAKLVYMQYLNTIGTIFIDADNHFFAYVIANGFSTYPYIERLYKNLICDYNGNLFSLCGSGGQVNTNSMNIQINDNNYYSEDDSTKQNITLAPLRVYGTYRNEKDTTNVYVRTFVKNAYVNYERKFQPGLKFIDQNGNKFVTLGGYLLYKVD